MGQTFKDLWGAATGQGPGQQPGPAQQPGAPQQPGGQVQTGFKSGIKGLWDQTDIGRMTSKTPPTDEQRAAMTQRAQQLNQTIQGNQNQLSSQVAAGNQNGMRMVNSGLQDALARAFSAMNTAGGPPRA